jgi:Fatty acid desaturase
LAHRSASGCSTFSTKIEHTFWSRGKTWDLREAALYGNSHYDLPTVLRWVTANIGLHHVHHLCSRIPFYRLQLALRQHPDLVDVDRLTLGQSFSCVRRVLWDETAGRLVTFGELQNRFNAGPADGGAARRCPLVRQPFCATRHALWSVLQTSPEPGNDNNRHLAGQSGRFAFADCQAHVQTLPNIENFGAQGTRSRG